MTALELLAACRAHGRERTSLAARMEDLEEAATSATAALDSMPGHSGAGDRYSAYMARRDELERRMREASRAWAAEQMAAILITGEMPERQRKCLRGFYVDGIPAAALADEMGYSASNIYKAMAEARDALKSIPPESVENALPGWYVKRYILKMEGEDE